MDIVVGSGPSGWSVTLALLARGREVTMIDGGQTLDQHAQEKQKTLAAISPDAWTQEQIETWQMPQFGSAENVARRFGSDYAQVIPEQTLQDPPDWFGLRASHAVGGLSNVWGAAVLPNRQADIADWPVKTADLAPHYKAIADVMPVSGRADRLETLFPAFPMSDRTPLSPGPQGRTLLKRLDQEGDALEREGVHSGQARQAIFSNCRYCGMCLHGCPWNLIFSTNHALDRLESNPKFTHLSGRIATRFSETNTKTELYLEDGTTLKADRVYLAAGVLETARIVLSSQPVPGQQLTLLDSQHFFLPTLHSWRPDGQPENDQHHTLTEAFIEIDDPQISPYLSHTQIYGWNEFYAREMIASYGTKLPGSASLFHALSRRLMVAQTFLHSDYSAQIGLRLGDNDTRLRATLHENPTTAPMIKAVKSKLAKSLRRVGLYALSFASRPGAPGSSFHSGGTLPMSATPGPLQTDPSGRLLGLERVYVVDASVLPSIPATTITFSVMANAHRIGTVS